MNLGLGPVIKMGFNRSRDAETRAGWKTGACSPTGDGAEPPGKEPHGAIVAVLWSLGISTMKLAFLLGLQRKTWRRWDILVGRVLVTTWVCCHYVLGHRESASFS